MKINVLLILDKLLANICKEMHVLGMSAEPILINITLSSILSKRFSIIIAHCITQNKYT